MSNRCEEIRALIPDEASALRMREIVAALPQYTRQQIGDSIRLMFNAAKPAILERIGNRSDGFRYFVARNVQIKAYPTKEARREATLVRERIRNRRRPGRTGMSLEQLREKQAAKRAAAGRAKVYRHRPPQRTMAEYRALQAERKAAKLAQQAEDRRKREAKREAERQATIAAIARRKAAERAKRRLTLAQRILAHAPAIIAADKPTQAAPAKPRVETVEEWMARTGQTVEVLPVHWNQARAA